MTTVPFKTLLAVLVFTLRNASEAFAPSRSLVAVGTDRNDVCSRGIERSPAAATATALFSSPIPAGDRPPPRRTLKKRKNKRRQRLDQLSQNRKITTLDNSNNHAQHAGRKSPFAEDDYEFEVVEIRPARRRDAVEAGLDYWIDDGDLEKERRRRRSRREAARNRESTEAGAMPKEKLREEVVAPYKQNWIGMLSVFVVILSAIGTNFPELLQIPVIPIPDL